jgi:hypothetical protein
VKKAAYIALLVLIVLAPQEFSQASTTGIYSQWDFPKSTTNLDAVTGSVKISDSVSPVTVKCRYIYPNGERGEVECKKDGSRPGIYRFTIPAKEDGGVGELNFSIAVRPNVETRSFITSQLQTVAAAYEEDLEITANPPEVLFFDLASSAYQVRYNPCCNILGASVIAKRLPNNPVPSEIGLPKTLLSDFIHLEPDDLSASTAGLYFTYTFDAEKVKSAGQDVPALYEYDMRKKEWFSSPNFKVVDGNKIDLHCPAGGYFVLGKTK